MALKVLMLRKKIDDAKKRLEALRSKGGDYDKRARELETAIEEATTPEEQRTVEEAVASYDQERADYDTEVADIEKEISDLEEELKDLEDSQPAPQTHTTITEVHSESTWTETVTSTEQRGVRHTMNHRSKILGSVRARQGLMEREDVKAFVATARDHIANKRAISGVGLLVPTVILGILRENIIDYSKLYKHVNAQYVPGTGRVGVMATVPEAVWTEMCANINELDLGFGVVDTDGYKVAGYFAICNAMAEDSDEELLVAIVDALGQAIGLALDKAILYGTGVKMPLGIVTRLVQTAKPSDYPATAPGWKDLHTSNVLSITAANSTGIKLYQALVKDMGAAKGKMSRGGKFWAMNEATYTTLIAEGMSVNAAGVIVSGIDGTMPIVGGVAEVLDFIPDNVIVGGYGSLYYLAERQETRIASSEHALFLQDQTVYKGTARYDGKPVVPEGFAVIGINGVTPTAEMTFAPDTANAAADNGDGTE